MFSAAKNIEQVKRIFYCLLKIQPFSRNKIELSLFFGFDFGKLFTLNQGFLVNSFERVELKGNEQFESINRKPTNIDI